MPNRKIGDGVSFIVSTSFTESQLEELKKIKGVSRSAFIRNSAMLCADYPHLAEAIGALKKGFVYDGIKVKPADTFLQIGENGSLVLLAKGLFAVYVDRYGQDWTL